MGRKEGKHEGYVLLDAIRKSNNKIPFIIYAGSRFTRRKEMLAMATILPI